MTRRRGVNAETADIGIGERVIMTPFPSFPAESHLRPGGLLVDALACFRLVRLVVDDQITDPWRQRIWDRHPPEEGGIGYALSCPFCFSIWAAGAVVTFRRLTPRAWQPLAELLALSAVAGELAARAGH